MKKFYYYLFIIIIFVIGCKSSSETDSEVKELQLLQSFDTEIPEPSGLTYNSKSNTLFAVSDANSTIYELDFSGKIIHSFPISNIDLEGICFSSNCDTLYVVDEANNQAAKYLANGQKLSFITINVATAPNSSLEGIALDNKNHLFVLNEKLPCILLEFNNQVELFRKELKFFSDCSDICYDKTTDCFWIISDESQKVVKVTKAGDLVEQFSIPFTKGEGITIVNDKIYIVNDETGKMYVFKKP